VRDFTDTYDSYGQNKSWYIKRRGFLKPLLIPNYIWSEISIDFITDLPELEGCTNIVVVTDRLSKGVVTNRLNNLEANIVAK
jgi:hypothetical protein